MTVVNIALGWVAYAAPIAYSALVILSVILLRPSGRRWQVVMDEFREMDLDLSMGNAARLIILWLFLTTLLVPIIRPDVFRPTSSAVEDEQVAS